LGIQEDKTHSSFKLVIGLLLFTLTLLFFSALFFPTFIKNQYQILIFLIYIVFFSVILLYTQKLYRSLKENFSENDSHHIRNSFLSNMTHELRTPLNSILLLSNLLQKNIGKNLDENQLKQVSIINQSGEELLAIIDNILNLSKLESDEIKVVQKNFSVIDLIAELIDFHSERFPLLHIEIKKIDKRNSTVFSDREKVFEILNNLLYFIERKVKTPESLLIEVSTQKKGLCTLVLTSSSIKLNQSERDQITSEKNIFTLTPENYHNIASLKLSIAKKLVQILKGQIKISPEGEVSTSISIVFPSLSVPRS
jgi:K+-sensing histidine kinase KdpD